MRWSMTAVCHPCYAFVNKAHQLHHCHGIITAEKGRIDLCTTWSNPPLHHILFLIKYTINQHPQTSNEDELNKNSGIMTCVLFTALVIVFISNTVEYAIHTHWLKSILDGFCGSITYLFTTLFHLGFRTVVRNKIMVFWKYWRFSY